MERPSEQATGTPAPPTGGRHDSVAGLLRPAMTPARWCFQAGPQTGPVLRLMAVVALLGLASFLIRGHDASPASPVPHSSLHVASLLAAQDRSAVAKPAQIGRSPAAPIPADIEAAASEAPRRHLPLVRARGNASPAPAANGGSPVPREAGHAVIVRSQDRPLELRREPDDNADVAESYPQGTAVTVLDTVLDWHRVIAPDGRWGWVRASGLAKEGSSSARPAARRIEVRPDRLPADGERP